MYNQFTSRISSIVDLLESEFTARLTKDAILLVEYGLTLTRLSLRRRTSPVLVQAQATQGGTFSIARGVILFW